MDDIKISLAACRVNAGLSQTEMAEILDVATATLVKYEAIPPRSDPPYHVVKKISQLSGIPINFIYIPQPETDSA